MTDQDYMVLAMDEARAYVVARAADARTMAQCLVEREVIEKSPSTSANGYSISN